MSSLTLELGTPVNLTVVRATVREAFSTPFVVSMVVLSPDPSLPLSSVIGRPAKLHVVAGTAFSLGMGNRTWTGIIRHAEQVKAVHPTGGEKSVSTYLIELVPRFWLLSQRRNYRIFQHISIPDIADKLLGEWNVPPTWRIDRGSYPKLEYKVQYGESDHQVLCRLLEEAGIVHFFEGEGGSSTQLILADRPESNTPRPGPALHFVDNPNQAAEIEFVTAVQWGRVVKPGARTLRDFDFRNPARALFEQAEPVSGIEGKLEQYEYDPAAFLAETGKPGDTPVADDKGFARVDPAYGKKKAERDLASMRVGARHLTFETNAYDLCPGTIFSIKGHPHADVPSSRKWLVTATSLSMSLQGEWNMRVSAVPADTSYKPPLVTPKPVVHGFQSATVVGPKGQEIHTDEFGRVRVEFPWDRQSKHDDSASCWVRVHEPWGGLGYGRINLPRIGQEVLVTFLEGDPDEPVILGRAYNAVQQVPYKLPTHKTRSTWKSDSSMGSGGFNEIMFEDLKAQELVWEQAQKDRIRLVKNDETITVVHDRQITVKNDLREETENNRRAWVGKDLDKVVKQSLRERVEGNSHEHVVGKKNGRIDKNLSVTVLDDTEEKVKGRYGLKSGKAFHIVSGETLVGEAQDVTIKAAGGFIRIDSAGVTVVGTVVKINNGGSAGKGIGPKTTDPADPDSYAAAPSEGGSPVAPKKEPAPPPTVECEIKTLEMECDHPKRAYKVKLPAAPKAKPPVNVIEVVAADKGNAEKIKTTISLAKPRCSKHKDGVIIKSAHETLAKPDVSTVEVYYGDKDIHGEILPLLWPWKDKPVEYTFTAQACKGLSSPAVVRVYPNVEPQVFFKFELDSDAIDDRTNKRMDVAQSRGYVEKRGRPAQTAWKFEFQGKIKYGSRSVALGLKLDDKFKKLAWMNLLVKRGIDFFCEVFYKFMGVRLLPIFPKVALQYEGKFKEIDNSYRVGAEWSFLFKADPLFGIKIKFDVLEGIIYAMGLIPQLKPVSTGLLKVKNWAKDKGQTFEIMLTISGEIGGEVGAKKEAAAPKAGVRGAIEGKVKVELMAKASFGSTGYVGFALGAEVGGDTGVVAGLALGNNDKGIYLKGRFALLECKLKVAAWASGKVIWEVKESYEGEFTLWEEQDFSKGQSWYLLGNA